jgi:hypothetical protein
MNGNCVYLTDVPSIEFRGLVGAASDVTPTMKKYNDRQPSLGNNLPGAVGAIWSKYIHPETTRAHMQMPRVITHEIASTYFRANKLFLLFSFFL